MEVKQKLAAEPAIEGIPNRSRIAPFNKVSRLIFNLLEANCPLDESIDSSTMESLRFRHSESNRDTEASILRDDRRATSLGEDIHKEAR